MTWSTCLRRSCRRWVLGQGWGGLLRRVLGRLGVWRGVPWAARICCGGSSGGEHRLSATTHPLSAKQLLLYPNPSDPLNGEAAALHMRDPVAYQKKARVHVCACVRCDDWDGVGVGNESQAAPAGRRLVLLLVPLLPPPPPPPPARAQVKDYVVRFAKPEDVAALEAQEAHGGGAGGDNMSEDDDEGGWGAGCCRQSHLGGDSAWEPWRHARR